MKNLLFVILCFLIVGVIIGCGETEEEAVTTEFTADDTVLGTIGEMKRPVDATPAAPSAPTDGTPYVKSVGYYSDWQLTEEMDSKTSVPIGTTIYNCTKLWTISKVRERAKFVQTLVKRCPKSLN